MRNERFSSAIVATGTVLLFAAALLLLPGCRNVIQPQEPPQPNVETGTFSLTVNGRERVRTIVPQVPAFARYRLVFDQDDTGSSFTAVYPDGLNPYVAGSPGGGFEVTLPVGTVWSLNVFAYIIQADDSEYSAHGLLAGISVGSGATGNVELRPVETGYGTFAWDITGIPDDVIGAFIMVYSLVDNSLAFFAEAEAGAGILDGRITGITTPDFPAGQYRVYLTVRYEDSEATTVSEILHVFRNMTSIWNWVFIPRGDALLDFVLDLWDAGTGIWDFFEAGITYEHFGNYGLGIGGVWEDNFWDLVHWFNMLTRDDMGDNVPGDLVGLKALVDAALIGMNGVYIAGNHSDEAVAEAAIRALVANAPESWELNDWVRIYWEGSRADVLVGGLYWVMLDDAIILLVTITFDGNAQNQDVGNMPGFYTGFSGGLVWGISIPERADYFFAGWNTSPDATGDRFMRGDPVEFGTTDITLYAIWSWFEFGLSVDDDTIVIRGLAEGRTETDIVIPSMINGVQVTEIGWGAFIGALWVDNMYVDGHQLTSVIISYGITNIGGSAFWGNQLTEITIPSSVTSIGSAAFISNELTEVTISSGVTYIGVSAFSGNQLTGVTIPASVTYIGASAFLGNQLAEVTIPSGVTRIESGVFLDNQLTEVTIPSGVTYIGESAFQGNQLTGVTIPPGVTYIGESAFLSNQLIEVTIPSGVTRIESGVFLDNQLTEVTIPSGVTYIGSWAFSSNQLTEVTIPSGVIYIGFQAFSSNELTSVDIPGSVTSIESGAFSNNQLTYVVIPDSVTSIGAHAFFSNELTSVDIPDGITSIESGAFSWNHLTSVVIPDSVTSIGSTAFEVNHLTYVVIPDGVIYIGAYAFWSNMLASVVIPDSVTSIGSGAFSSNGLAYVVIPNDVTYIGERAFSHNQLTSVVMYGVTSIGSEAFSHNQLTYVVIPGGASIGASAFSHNQLTSVVILNGITYIGEMAFAGNQLRSITIPGDMDIAGSSTMGIYGDEFLDLYESNGRQAGTYIWDGTQWELQ